MPAAILRGFGSISSARSVPWLTAKDRIPVSVAIGGSPKYGEDKRTVGKVTAMRVRGAPRRLPDEVRCRGAKSSSSAAGERCRRWCPRSDTGNTKLRGSTGDSRRSRHQPARRQIDPARWDRRSDRLCMPGSAFCLAALSAAARGVPSGSRVLQAATLHSPGQGRGADAGSTRGGRGRSGVESTRSRRGRRRPHRCRPGHRRSCGPYRFRGLAPVGSARAGRHVHRHPPELPRCPRPWTAPRPPVRPPF